MVCGVVLGVEFPVGLECFEEDLRHGCSIYAALWTENDSKFLSIKSRVSFWEITFDRKALEKNGLHRWTRG